MHNHIIGIRIDVGNTTLAHLEVSELRLVEDIWFIGTWLVDEQVDIVEWVVMDYAFHVHSGIVCGYALETPEFISGREYQCLVVLECGARCADKVRS